MTRLPYGWVHVCAVAVVLSVTAALTPDPWYETDRTTYQEIGQAIVLRDCSSLHCTRVLVPAVLEQLPGPSMPKWTAFAIAANTWAAAAVATLALSLGLTPIAALIAMWLTAIGFGTLFTLYDPYSADPLMFALGPVMTRWLVEGRHRAAGIAGAIGVFAKEFAAAPLWIWTGASVLARRWSDALRTGTIAFAVTVLWALLQAVLSIAFNNTYRGHPSADLFGGGYITFWFRELGVRTGIVAVLTEYGALYLLVPIGFAWAVPELRRIALASIPAVLAFIYVQQPDRALWNFHFIVTPLAAIVLGRAPLAVVIAFVATFAVANLRLAAQWMFLPAARYALGLSIVIAGIAAVLAWRSTRERAAKPVVPRPAIAGFPRAYRTLLAAAVVVAAAVTVLLADIAVHRASETEHGLNWRGYRGEIALAKRPGETRMALVGGATVFSPDQRRDQSTAKVLSNFLRQPWRWIAAGREYKPTSVVDLSYPTDTAARAAEALRDYPEVDADVVGIVTGYNDLPGVEPPAEGRRKSTSFRAFGYVPALPSWLMKAPAVPPAPVPPVDVAWIRTHMHARSDPVPARPCDAAWARYCTAVADAVDYCLSRGQQVVVVTEPYISRDHYAQQRALAGMLADRYGSNPRVQYRDLGWLVNHLDPALATDGWKLRAAGIEAFVDGLVSTFMATVAVS